MRKFKGELILITAAFIWGTSFVTQKLGMNYVEPFTFGAARFLLGALVLIPVILLFEKVNKKNKSRENIESEEIEFNNRDLIKAGILCGIAVYLRALIARQIS